MIYELKKDEHFLSQGQRFNRTSETDWKIIHKHTQAEVQLSETDLQYFESKKATMNEVE